MKGCAAFLLLLVGCAHQSTVTKVVPVDPSMTEQVPEPQLRGTKNKDLTDWIDRLREALREANRRLQAIGQIH